MENKYVRKNKYLKKNQENMLEVTYDELIKNYNYDKIVIDLKKKQNIIMLSKKNEKIYQIYKKLLANDFMFYFHSGTRSYFVKRKLIKSLWKRKDLLQYGELFYTIEDPIQNRVNKLSPLRLLVIFSSMPADDYYEPNIGVRCFTNNFSTIQSTIIKNTMVMRIMDINLSHGSHYVNTENYPNYESDIQGSIVKVMSEYNIHKDDVVLYGGSKGGTGALYHSLIGDYKSVSVDPIISLGEYNEILRDSHYLKGLRKESILKELLDLNKNSFSYNKVIIGSPAVPFNYHLFSQLQNEKIIIHDIFDESIKNHPDISSSCISEQITFINSHFLNSMNYVNKKNKIKRIYKDLENV